MAEGNGHDVTTKPPKAPKKPKGKWGGARPGGGLKGKTKKRIAHIEDVKATGETPLEFMLRIMRSPNLPFERRLNAAVAAAPYIHPRLSTLTISGDKVLPLSATPMSEEEFAAKHGADVCVEAPAGTAGRLN